MIQSRRLPILLVLPQGPSTSFSATTFGLHEMGSVNKKRILIIVLVLLIVFLLASNFLPLLNY